MKKALSVLNQLEKSRIIERYAIGGAMAATFYVEPFTTFDLDVFVIVPQTPSAMFFSLSSVYEALHAMGYSDEKECVLIEGIPVQFLPAYNPLLEEALAQAQDLLYEDVPTRVLLSEHLAAVAVQTGRAKDRMRVQMFLDAGVLDLAKLNGILLKYGLEEKWKQWTGKLQ